MSDTAEKDQKPTTRKLEQAREKGNVPRSRELGPAFAFLSVASLAVLAGGAPWTEPFATLGPALDTAAALSFDVDTAWLVMRGSALAWLKPALVLLGAAAGGALIAQVLQGGPQPTAETLKIDPKRMDPAGKLKSLFSMTHGWDMLRGLISALAAAWVLYAQLKKLAPTLPGLMLTGTQGVAAQIGEILLAVCWRIGLALALLGVLDLVVSRFLYMRNLRMSRQELKEEMKEQEGSPEVKLKRRRRLLELVRSRNIGGVARADVVIANPTHYAVALAYRRASMGAPKVLAKGRNRMALKIRLEAVKHGIPVVENPPLARELYRKVEVDREVPPELYMAVAEVIAFVMRLRTALEPLADEALAAPQEERR